MADFPRLLQAPAMAFTLNLRRSLIPTSLLYDPRLDSDGSACCIAKRRPLACSG